MARRPKKAPASAPSPAELERQRRAAIEERARRDFEASTGEPWSEVPPGSRAEYLGMAERAIRSEAARPPGDPPTPAPAPAPAPQTGVSTEFLLKLMRSIAGPIKCAIEDRTGPLAQRATRAEERLAVVEARLAELERDQ